MVLQRNDVIDLTPFGILSVESLQNPEVIYGLICWLADLLIAVLIDL